MYHAHWGSRVLLWRAPALSLPLCQARPGPPRCARRLGGWGERFGKTAQLTGPLISYYELAPKQFSIENGHSPPPPPNTWQMMTSLNPLDALIPKIPCSFFAEFWVRVTSEARGSVSVGFWGTRQLSPLGGRLARGLCCPPPPPPPQTTARPPLCSTSMSEPRSRRGGEGGAGGVSPRVRGPAAAARTRRPDAAREGQTRCLRKEPATRRDVTQGGVSPRV